MQNAIIPLISAIIFLGIGLFIGKSNKQIEIQTIVKTNIVEKPVEKLVEKIVEKTVEKPVIEYIPKYITNFVEKVVESEPSEKELKYISFADGLFNGKELKNNDLPFIESLRVRVEISDVFKNVISESALKDNIELCLRNNGIQVDENSKFILSATFTGLKINDEMQCVFTKTLSVNTITFIYDFKNLIGYKDYSEIWQYSNTGVVGRNLLNQSFVSNAFTPYMGYLMNKILKAKDQMKIQN
jgi:hypothetical protein